MRDLIINKELPQPALARWASVFFTLSVLTFLVSIAASQLCLTLACLLYFAHLLHAKPTPAIKFPPVKLPLALFCVWTVISLCFAQFPAAGGFTIRKLTLFLILLLTVNLIVSARHLLFLLKLLFLEAAVAGVVGAAQFVRQYRAVRVHHPHKIYLYMTVTRIVGFQGHWMNFGGQQMMMFAALSAFLLLAAAGARREGAAQLGSPTKLWWFVLAIVTLSILLNLTRGVWLGCFIAAVYLVAQWRAKWLWALPVLIALTLIAGPRMLQRREESVLHPSRDVSLAERFEMWQVGWKMIKKHPLVGVGPENIPGLYNFYLPPGRTAIIGYHDHLHDNFIQLAAERGLPCLAAWLWLMGAFLWQILRIRRRRARLKWVADTGIAVWLALMVEGVFEFNFGSSPVLM
ncbi:MAG: O-antigen ligase family protein, partial [Terriglobia bacterium]